MRRLLLGLVVFAIAFVGLGLCVLVGLGLIALLARSGLGDLIPVLWLTFSAAAIAVGVSLVDWITEGGVQ